MLPEKVGLPTNTGNICERLLKDHRHILVSLAPLRFHSEMNNLFNRLWVILVVYTSTSKDEVNTLLFRELCEETYDLLQNSFQNSESKWINVSPTLHLLLAHSRKVIENNNNCGVGEYSETGLEHNNKFL